MEELNGLRKTLGSKKEDFSYMAKEMLIGEIFYFLTFKKMVVINKRFDNLNWEIKIFPDYLSLSGVASEVLTNQFDALGFDIRNRAQDDSYSEIMNTRSALGLLSLTELSIAYEEITKEF